MQYWWREARESGTVGWEEKTVQKCVWPQTNTHIPEVDSLQVCSILKKDLNLSTVTYYFFSFHFQNKVLSIDGVKVKLQVRIRQNMCLYESSQVKGVNQIRIRLQPLRRCSRLSDLVSNPTWLQHKTYFSLSLACCLLTLFCEDNQWSWHKKYPRDNLGVSISMKTFH